MKVRILYNSGGSVSIIHPALKSKRDDENEDQWAERIFTKDTPIGTRYKDISNTELPSTRRFRNQWIEDINGVKPDLTRSKNQIIEELREVRNKELIVTDGLLARENEIGTPQSQQDIKNYRVKLRDLPATLNSKLNLIDDVTSLEAEYPGILKIEEYITK